MDDEVRGGGAAGLRETGHARARTRRRAAAEAGAAWSGGGGGSRAAATAGDDLEGRLHGPCGEDAEVRGSAGEDDEAWGRPGWGRPRGAATVERRPGTHARPGKKAAAHAGERTRAGWAMSGRRGDVDLNLAKGPR